jgi:hypothetical protein
MVTELKLLSAEFNASNRIAVKVSWVRIYAIIVWISQMIAILLARFPRFNAYCEDISFKAFEDTMRGGQVAIPQIQFPSGRNDSATEDSLNQRGHRPHCG